MPYKFEYKNKKLPKELNRNIKLTLQDKKEIQLLLKDGYYQSEIARKYNVSRKSIYFIKYPEKLKQNIEDYKIKRLDGRYYDKDKNTEAIKNTRRYKQKNKNLLI